MKQLFVLVLLSVIFVLSGFTAASAESGLSTIGIGFASFNYSYDPAWGSQYDSFKSGSGSENGMFLVTGKGDFQLSFLVMSTIFGSNGSLEFGRDGATLDKSGSASMERSDFDLVLQYNIWEGLNIFGGLKLFNILMDSPDMNVNGTPISIESYDDNPCEFSGLGFGAGLSYTQVAIANDSFAVALQPALSYVFVSGDATQSFIYFTNYNESMTQMDDYSATRYTAQGYNGVLNLLIIINLGQSSSGGGTSLIVSAGYRYQYLAYKASESYIDLADEKHRGVMFMVMFSSKYRSMGCCIL